MAENFPTWEDIWTSRFMRPKESQRGLAKWKIKKAEDLFFEKIHTIKPLARLAGAKTEKAKKIKLQMKEETI